MSENNLGCIVLSATTEEINSCFEEYILALSRYKWSKEPVSVKFVILLNQKLTDVIHEKVDKLCFKYLPEEVYKNYDIVSVGIDKNDDVYLPNPTYVEQYLSHTMIPRPRYGWNSGSNIMFFRSIKFLSSFGVTLRLEMDSLPVQDYWFDELNNWVKASHFWVSGSYYSGNTSIHDLILSHFNGVALYNFGDSMFCQFLEEFEFFMVNNINKYQFLSFDSGLEIYRKYLFGKIPERNYRFIMSQFVVYNRILNLSLRNDEQMHSLPDYYLIIHNRQIRRLVLETWINEQKNARTEEEWEAYKLKEREEFERKAREEERQRIENEARLKNEKAKKVMEEAQRLAKEAQLAIEEAKLLEENARKAEEDLKRIDEEKRKMEEDEGRMRDEEEQRRIFEEIRQKAEEEAKRKAEAEEMRKKMEKEERIRAEERKRREEDRLRREKEENERKRREKEEEEKRQVEILQKNEELKKKTEEEEKQKAINDAAEKVRLAEEEKRLREEEIKRRRTYEAKCEAEEAARQRVAEAKQKLEEEAERRRLEEERNRMVEEMIKNENTDDSEEEPEQIGERDLENKLNALRMQLMGPTPKNERIRIRRNNKKK